MPRQMTSQLAEEAAPRLFISYSHDSREHQDRVRALADRLRADGVDAVIDQYDTAPPDGWPIWMDLHGEQPTAEQPAEIRNIRIGSPIRSR